MEITVEQETQAMMRIAELIQENVGSEDPMTNRRLLCSIYFLGKEDEKAGR